MFWASVPLCPSRIILSRAPITESVSEGAGAKFMKMCFDSVLLCSNFKGYRIHRSSGVGVPSSGIHHSSLTSTVELEKMLYEYVVFVFAVSLRQQMCERSGDACICCATMLTRACVCVSQCACVCAAVTVGILPNQRRLPRQVSGGGGRRRRRRLPGIRVPEEGGQGRLAAQLEERGPPGQLQ